MYYENLPKDMESNQLVTLFVVYKYNTQKWTVQNAQKST